MNNCSFIGRFGKEPELKRTNSGKAVVTFSLAVNREGKKDEADWINFTAWEKTAELISKYCHKGDQIGVNGSLQQRSYEDIDGNKRTVHEVRVNRIYFLGRGKSGEARKNDLAERISNAGFSEADADDIDGELPF